MRFSNEASIVWNPMLWSHHPLKPLKKVNFHLVLLTQVWLLNLWKVEGKTNPLFNFKSQKHKLWALLLLVISSRSGQINLTSGVYSTRGSSPALETVVGALMIGSCLPMSVPLLRLSNAHNTQSPAMCDSPCNWVLIQNSDVDVVNKVSNYSVQSVVINEFLAMLSVFPALQESQGPT